MRRHLLSITILICVLVCAGAGAQAQVLKEKADKIVQSLLKSGIDTVLIYDPYSSSHMFSDSSFLEDITYVISKQGGKLVFERLTSEYVDNKGHIFTHKVLVRPDTLQVFRFLGKHFNPIFSDTLLPAMVKYRIDGKDTLMRYLGSHPSYTQLAALTRGGQYSNGFIHYDLYDGTIHNEDGSVRDKIESINYQYNVSRSIYKIISLLQQEVLEIQKIYKY